MDSGLIQKIRSFNRYYTAWLDVMNKAYLGTELTWPESRVLFEIYMYPEISATGLCGHLRMDKSYVSRILAKFEKQGLLERELIPGTRGQKRLHLTQDGIKTAEQIDRSGNCQIAGKLKDMTPETCRELCRAMEFIEKTLRENEAKEIKK